MWQEVLKIQVGSTKVGLTNVPDIPEDNNCCQEAIIKIDKLLKKLHGVIDKTFEGEQLAGIDAGTKIKMREGEKYHELGEWEYNLTYKSNFDINNERLMCYLLDVIGVRSNHQPRSMFGISGHTTFGNAALSFRYWGDENVKELVEIGLDRIKVIASEERKKCLENIKYFDGSPIWANVLTDRRWEI